MNEKDVCLSYTGHWTSAREIYKVKYIEDHVMICKDEIAKVRCCKEALSDMQSDMKPLPARAKPHAYSFQITGEPK